MTVFQELPDGLHWGESGIENAALPCGLLWEAKMKAIIFILFLFLFCIAPPGSANEWTEKTPSLSPSARMSPAMASIGGDQVLLYGGYDVANDTETWVYDLSDNTWTQKQPSTFPGPRSCSALAPLGGDRVLLFGGEFSGVDGETWVYDLSENNWTLNTPTTAPPRRSCPAMAYLGDDQVLLFGGIADERLNDTWIYDLSENTWTEKTPSGTPAARYIHAMAYLGGDLALLFGGSTVNGLSGEAWVYNLSLNTWTEKTPAISPSGRFRLAMAYAGGDQVVLFGGYTGVYDGATWVYDLGDNTWTQKVTDTAPPARNWHAMASVGAGSVVLFGGIGAAFYADTWVYSLVQPLSAHMDIKFCGNPNSFNCKKSGVLPVMIFGSTDIDVTAVNLSTVQLCLSNNIENCVSAIDAEFPIDRGNPATDLGTTECRRNVAHPDGFDDLGVLFVGKEVATLINCSSTGKKAVSPTLIIKGELSDATPFISTPLDDAGVDQLCVANK